MAPENVAEKRASGVVPESAQGMECPLCGSPDVVERIPRVDDHITGDPFHIRGCRACGVCFTHPMPREMDRYYPSKYRGYSSLTKAVLGTLYRLRVRKWLRMVKGTGSVLEVGCGPGLMLEALRKHGWQVTGIERTESMAAYAREKLGLNVIPGGIEALPKGLAFDLIVMFQVLEHMPNPLSILKECAARLKPGESSSSMFLILIAGKRIMANIYGFISIPKTSLPLHAKIPGVCPSDAGGRSSCEICFL